MSSLWATWHLWAHGIQPQQEARQGLWELPGILPLALQEQLSRLPRTRYTIGSMYIGICGSRRLWNTKQRLGEVSSNHQAMDCPLLSHKTLELQRKHFHTTENRTRTTHTPLRAESKGWAANSGGWGSPKTHTSAIIQGHWESTARTPSLLPSFNVIEHNRLSIRELRTIFSWVRLCPKTQSKKQLV